MLLADANGPLSASGVDETPTLTPTPIATDGATPVATESMTVASPTPEVFDGVLPTQGMNWTWLWIVLGVLIVLAILWFLSRRKGL